VIPPYANWLFSRAIGRTPELKLPSGAKLSHFRSFSEFWCNRFALDGPEIALVQKCSQSTGVLIDVGANIGAYSALLSAICPQARIFAFEPSPDTAAVLRLNLRSSEATNVMVESTAVADFDGSSEFVNRSSGSVLNRLTLEPEAGVTISVATTTLDSFAAVHGIDRIDFIKIDVEGAEPLVLRGACRLMREHRIRIGMIEICPANLSKFGFSLSDLFSAASRNRYKICTLLPDGSAGRDCDGSEFGETALCNAVLMPT
jgi:FkbM family methyltransferase